ncbi:MAG: PRC-barrel domain containing protein [Alphaproteobacteria bacterium]|nr:PRC-barrel domain containing protein [Alphaproteobacteria bacterium]
MAQPASNLESRETYDLIAADKVEGTSVYNTKGDKLGSVENVMIDKRSGRVAYAVMSFGGFLGIGDQHHPLPWSVLKYDTNQGGYVVNLDKKALEGAPSYKRDEPVDLGTADWDRRLHSYYKVPPFYL